MLAMACTMVSCLAFLPYTRHECSTVRFSAIPCGVRSMRLEQLGPYKILKPLGHGGMGSVYEGEHITSGERAAIKVLAEALSDDARFRERFKAEVETLKILRHKNIVSLLGFGEEQGRMYFVMELVEGKSLDDVMKSGHPFDWRAVADVGVQVCAALKHAHDHGVVHRDLKPANLLITPAGEIKLTDFGIAKIFGGTSLTMVGSMIGTPDYMAPEQTEGKPATARSDLFSLGCVLYSLLAGRPPFKGDSVTHVIDQVRSADPPPLTRFAPETPAEFEEILRLMLAKDPDRRIQTPQAVGKLLQAMRHVLGTDEKVSEVTTVDDPPATNLPATQIGGATVSDDDAKSTKKENSTAELDQTVAFSSEHEPSATRVETSGFELASSADQAENISTNVGSADESSQTQINEPKTHFTTVSEAARNEAAASKMAQHYEKHYEKWKAVAMAAVLLAIVASFVFVMLPRSADKLYLEIENGAKLTPPPDDFPSDIREFLDRFPSDNRVDKVEHWQQEYETARLRDHLKNKPISLTDWEKLYLQAMDSLDDGDRQSAINSLEQIIHEYQDLGGSRSDRRIFERAEYLAAKLKNS